MEGSGTRVSALGLAAGETTIRTWLGRHDYPTYGRSGRGFRGGKRKGELVLTNRRLLFIREASEAFFVKEVDCPLGELIDVTFQEGLLGSYIVVGSGVGNIRLRLDDVNKATFGDFKSALESASGKSLSPSK